MAKNRKQKEDIVGLLSDEIRESKGVVFANFHGLTMKESDELRSVCKSAGVRYVVTKKTLLRKAAEIAGFAIDAKAYDGGVSVLASRSDEVAPAQVLAGFAKSHEIARIFSGILDGKLIGDKEVAALAKLPNKQQLLGQLVATINAPVSGFVNVLAGNLRGFVTVLGAIKEKKLAS